MPVLARPTENHLSLVLTVLHVGDREQSRIKENGGGQFKGDAVLASICIRLGLVPLELERPLIHHSLIPCWPKDRQPRDQRPNMYVPSAQIGAGS